MRFNPAVFAAAVTIAFSAAALPSPGRSYAYNPATEMPGEGELVLDPMFWAPSFNPAVAGIDFLTVYGVSGRIDLTVDFANVTAVPGFSYNYSWAMARYDFGGNNIAALEAGQYFISPQYHYFWENDSWAFEVNLLSIFTYTNFNGPAAGAYLAPAYKILPDRFLVYLEFDPFYTAGPGNGSNGFTLAVLPGIWYSFGDAGQVSLAVMLGDVTGKFTPGAALWYAVSFNLKPAGKHP